MGCIARILSGGETPVELIESGWLVPIPSGSGGCHPVYPKRVEGATLFEQLPPTPQPMRSIRRRSTSRPLETRRERQTSWNPHC